MKNMRLILAGALLFLSGIFSAVAQTNWTGYRPTDRATTLEDGVTYMIYNTAFNDAQDRTGFISSAASGFGHTGDAHPKPSAFSTVSNTYLWKVTSGNGKICQRHRHIHRRSTKSNLRAGLEHVFMPET